MESVKKFTLKRGIRIQKGTLIFRQHFYYESVYLKKTVNLISLCYFYLLCHIRAYYDRF